MAHEGIFAVYKPVGPTSNDVLNFLRRVFGTKKIGHAGTLDPLAKGVLVVGVGREATKHLGDVVAKEKEYVAKVRLGMTSTTDDEEGQKEKVEARNDKKPDRAEVESIIKKFVGRIRQIPPVFSAVKVKGKEAYKSARQGKFVKLKPRPVFVKEIAILKYRWPYLWFRAVTGPGVYVRALARDIGKKLGVGGYLAALERTRVGNFRKDTSVTLREIGNLKKKSPLPGERAR